MAFLSDLDTRLLQLSSQDHFTLGDACNGVHIFGGIGSGKTSGSGKTLAGAYLRAGMGGLVLCAKPEEVELWDNYAQEHGRKNSVIFFDEKRSFNFIDYELARQGMEGISNVIECLMRILEAADLATGKQGQSSDPFWGDSTRLVLNYTLPMIYAAYGKVTVENIIEFVSTIHTKPEQLRDAAWAKRYAGRTIQLALDKPQVTMGPDVIRSMRQFWGTQYQNIPEKTRGNIVISLSARLDRFKHGRLKRIFCDQTDIVPEMCFHGAIIIMNMPSLTWNEDGIIGQQLFKFMWQRAVESRNGLEQTQRERPVFLWADEAQYFVNLKDEKFLSTCRGSKACVVFLTQTLPTYYAALGKQNTDAADGVVGKFNTQIFHQNACTRTNTFASELIGRGLQLRNTTGKSFGTTKSHGMTEGETTGSGNSLGGQRRSLSDALLGGSSYGRSQSDGASRGGNVGQGINEGISSGTTEQMDYWVEPNYFASQLKSGGKDHGNKVTAVWFKVGANFKSAQGSNKNMLDVTFKQ